MDATEVYAFPTTDSFSLAREVWWEMGPEEASLPYRGGHSLCS